MARPRQRRLFYRRAWLNKPDHHSTAAVIAKVTRTTHRNDEVTIGIELQISDCTRKIELDFYGGGTVEQVANDLFKLDLLADTICRVRDTVRAEYLKLEPFPEKD